ncbi:class I SAM-dependent DNA methyltransferase [Streptomyces sp. NPDC101225]|uniref:class I SAM-dependent DNA methyltransferase n=1 Tax=Streptomyces sp. NPDC101225 TaxID=3366135 RepID=UPI0038060A8B
MSSEKPAGPDFLYTTRVSYDAIAEPYGEQYADHLGDQPLDLALVTAFAELVRASGTAPVADVGSGPGHVTARLGALGIAAFGVDVSPGMVALARRAHPGIRFHVGSMTSLDLPDATLGGVLALYSVIHVPDDHLPAVFAEFHRVLVPGGHVLLGFQSGDEDGRLRMTQRFGRDIALDYYWRTPDSVARPLAEAGLRLRARVLREPAGREKRPRAFLLARKES